MSIEGVANGQRAAEAQKPERSEAKPREQDSREANREAETAEVRKEGVGEKVSVTA